MAALSDQEIRTRLKSYGYDAGPITENTRAVYIKKLHAFEEGHSEIPSRRSLRTPNRRTSLAAFSDDSESDRGSLTRLGVDSSSDNVKKTPRRRSTRITTPSRRDAGLINNSNNSHDYDDDSLSSPPQFATPAPVSRSSASGRISGAATPSSRLLSESASLPTVMVRKQTGQPSTPYSPFAAASMTPNRRRSVRLTPRIPPGSQNKRKGNSFNGTHTETDSDLDTDNDSAPVSPYFSSSSKASISATPSFRSRVRSWFRSNSNELAVADPLPRSLSVPSPSISAPVMPATRRPQVGYRQAVGPPNRIVNHHGYPEPVGTDSWVPDKFRHVNENGHGDSFLDTQFQTADDFETATGRISWQWVSRLLLVLIFVFFLTLTALYVRTIQPKDSSDYSTASYTSSNISSRVCKTEDEATLTKWVMNCIPEKNLQNVTFVTKGIYADLLTQAGSFECGQAESRNLSVDHLVERYDQLGFTKEIVSNSIFIISQTPQWHVRLFNKSGSETTELRDVHWLQSDRADRPFLCRIRMATGAVVYKALTVVGCIATAILVVALGYFLIQRKNAREKEIIALTENIVEILQRHSEDCRTNAAITPYMAIPHVRDMLLSATERKSKQDVWEAAVRLINETDSRVRVETQEVAGENFLVWRWIHNGRAPGEVKKTKVWQGQAFEAKTPGINAPICSPTQCLKIRNMFDVENEQGENWPAHIQEAILEKCEESLKELGQDLGGNAASGILHVKVDTTSREGCVYAKCTDPAAAGKVYTALHGSWFDGKLVTVKYLRLERYHERFPEAAAFKTIMKPSNVNRSSMTLYPDLSLLDNS